MHSPEQILDDAKTMSRDRLPLYSWIGFRGHCESDGTTTLFTEGMAAFGFMEIEIVKSHHNSELLIDRAFNMAHYVMDSGPVLKDGDTFGLSAEEMIKIRHSPSIWDKSRTVYRLDL